MSAILLTPPAIEPLSLAEARDFLRLDHDEDDDVLAALIAAARLRVEAHTRRALIAQHWRLVRDCWPASGLLKLLPVPVRALEAVRLWTEEGVPQELDLTAFVLDAVSAPARLRFARDTLTQPGRPFAGIEIDIEAGYGAAAADVPAPLRHAIRLLVTHWYENRALVNASGEVAAMPASVLSLVAPYRVVSL